MYWPPGVRAKDCSIHLHGTEDGTGPTSQAVQPRAVVLNREQKTEQGQFKLCI